MSRVNSVWEEKMADKKSLENSASVKEKPVKKQMCSRHPDRPAKHTTTSSAHWPISLCDQCLAEAPHMGER